MYLQAEKIVWVVSDLFASLNHEVLELLVNLSWGVLSREQVACSLAIVQRSVGFQVLCN